jgi:microcystin-dependent protein
MSLLRSKYITTSLKPLTLLILVFQFGPSKAQNVGINANGQAPNASAALDIDVSAFTEKKGLLIPRVTSSEREAMNPLPAAAQGLLLYQTDGIEGFYYNTSTNTAPTWVYISGATAATNIIPSGTILPYGGSSAPTGYLLCDDSEVDRTTYTDLFAAVGTAFGSGNGNTTFNIPDFRGTFLRGVDGTAGKDPDNTTRTAMQTGGNTGNAVGSVQSSQVISHTHTVRLNPGTSSYNNFIPGTYNQVGGNGFGTPHSAPLSAVGGSETRPANAYVNYIIKL